MLKIIVRAALFILGGLLLTVIILNQFHESPLPEVESLLSHALPTTKTLHRPLVFDESTWNSIEIQSDEIKLDWIYKNIAQVKTNLQNTASAELLTSDLEFLLRNLSLVQIHFGDENYLSAISKKIIARIKEDAQSVLDNKKLIFANLFAKHRIGALHDINTKPLMGILKAMDLFYDKNATLNWIYKASENESKFIACLQESTCQQISYEIPPLGKGYINPLGQIAMQEYALASAVMMDSILKAQTAYQELAQSLGQK